jgi:hypothetical protein
MTNLTRGRKKIATSALMPVIGFLCLILWIAAPVVAAEPEEPHLDLGTNKIAGPKDLFLEWEIASVHEGHLPLMIEFIRKGDDINNWKELFTYQNFAKGKQTPEEFLNKLKAAREKECPGATVWNVIEQNESSILYEWRAKPCLGWPEQHEVARIILGNHNLFVLHYVAKVPELAPDTRTKWIKTFHDATVDSGAKSGHR